MSKDGLEVNERISSSRVECPALVSHDGLIRDVWGLGQVYFKILGRVLVNSTTVHTIHTHIMTAGHHSRKSKCHRRRI